jgi:hypothetical protein
MPASKQALFAEVSAATMASATVASAAGLLAGIGIGAASPNTGMLARSAGNAM